MDGGVDTDKAEELEPVGVATRALAFEPPIFRTTSAQVLTEEDTCAGMREGR